MDWFDSILHPIMLVVAWIMVNIHDLLRTIHVNEDIAWVASIVALVIFMRALMIPLFVKQIRASRGLQLIQPEMQRIQKKYKGKNDPASRQKMTEETMALYRQSGTNPMSSCWPILLQSPIFFALFRVLYSLPQISAGSRDPIGALDQAAATAAEKATLFGAPLSATFMQADKVADPFSPVTVRVVTVILIILMSVTTFTTQRQLTMKNMPQAALDNPMAKQQKMLVYMMPFIFFISGPNFPIGVLIYWLTTNLWTMGQQYFVIKRMPSPGSEAERRLKEKQARKHGTTIEAEAALEIEERRTGQREQPMSAARKKKKGIKPGAQPSKPSHPAKADADSAAAAEGARAEAEGGASAKEEKAAKDAAKDPAKGAGGPAAGKPGATKPPSSKPASSKPGANQDKTAGQAAGKKSKGGKDRRRS